MSAFEAEHEARKARDAQLAAQVAKALADDLRSDWAMEIVKDAEHGRWEAILNEDTVAELSYRLVGGRVVLLSTWVAYPYRQQHVATELIARVLDEIRDTGKKITVICPVIGAFIAHNQAYGDLVDPRHPGSGMSTVLAGASDEEQLARLEQELG
jgi:predicted GNAT family acetyltransferase